MDRVLFEQKLNEFLDDVMNLNDLPGLAAGVSLGSSTAAAAGSEPYRFTGARGYKDCITRTPLQEDDIFHCASVSKLFTSSALMKLVEAGVLRTDDRLCDVLPDLHIADKRFGEIRLWNMLTHTSGLGDVSDYRWYDFETDDASLRRYVYESDEVLAQPMLWAPETLGDEAPRFRYSNIAYEILGQIIAEYSGRMPDAEGSLSYEDFVARYLLEPAGMNASTMKTFEREGAPDFRSNGRMALPHDKKADRSIGPVSHYPYTRQHAPSSTLTSTVRDLLRWGEAHLSGMLFAPETYRTIWSDYATVPNNGEKMGLGWFMREQRSFTLYGHEGTDDGFRASFWICPQLDLVTVVLSNLSGAPVKKINRKMFDVIAGFPEK